MSTKEKNERLSLALRKNLKKRKLFQKKVKKKNKASRTKSRLSKKVKALT